MNSRIRELLKEAPRGRSLLLMGSVVALCIFHQTRIIPLEADLESLTMEVGIMHSRLSLRSNLELQLEDQLLRLRSTQDQLHRLNHGLATPDFLAAQMVKLEAALRMSGLKTERLVQKDSPKEPCSDPMTIELLARGDFKALLNFLERLVDPGFSIYFESFQVLALETSGPSGDTLSVEGRLSTALPCLPASDSDVLSRAGSYAAREQGERP